MFLEKINEQLLEEIQDELYGEHDEIEENWNGVWIDLVNEDFEDILYSEIFEHYHHIPLYRLADMINQHLPFLKEKELSIDPFYEISIYKNDDYEEVVLQVYADVCPGVREMLSKMECKQLNNLLEELTHLYEDLDTDSRLYIKHIQIEDVPEEYYTYGNEIDDDENKHDFVQIEF